MLDFMAPPRLMTVAAGPLAYAEGAAFCSLEGTGAIASAGLAEDGWLRD